MNAKFLEKFIVYRKSKNATETIRIILNEKIKRQLHFIKINPEKYLIPKEVTLAKFNLHEARAARIYWRYWKDNLKNKVEFKGRIQHSNDSVNKLLDVGYHFLYNYL